MSDIAEASDGFRSWTGEAKGCVLTPADVRRLRVLLPTIFGGGPARIEACGARYSLEVDRVFRGVDLLGVRGVSEPREGGISCMVSGSCELQVACRVKAQRAWKPVSRGPRMTAEG